MFNNLTAMGPKFGAQSRFPFNSMIFAKALFKIIFNVKYKFNNSGRKCIKNVLMMQNKPDSTYTAE